MTEARRFAALAAAVTIPVCLGTIALAVFSALDAVGYTPFTDGPPLNVVEAAANGNAAEVLRRLSIGEDLRRAQPVRPDVISSSVRFATPLEAAVWSRQGALLKLLDAYGGIADAGARRHLVCLALDIESEEAAEALGGAGEAACAPGEALRTVTSRDAAGR